MSTPKKQTATLADAALRRAAPDLLAACKSALAYLLGDSLDPAYRGLDETRAALNAARLKAEGRKRGGAR